MASIPEDPAEQFLFFIDNRIVAGEPGGHALITEFLQLVVPMIGDPSSASSAMAALFDDEPFASSAPVEGAPAGDSHGGKGGGHGGDDAGAALDLALGLFGGFARGGELDL